MPVTPSSSQNTFAAKHCFVTRTRVFLGSRSACLCAMQVQGNSFLAEPSRFGPRFHRSPQCRERTSGHSCAAPRGKTWLPPVAPTPRVPTSSPSVGKQHWRILGYFINDLMTDHPTTTALVCSSISLWTTHWWRKTGLLHVPSIVTPRAPRLYLGPDPRPRKRRRRRQHATRPSPGETSSPSTRSCPS